MNFLDKVFTPRKDNFLEKRTLYLLHITVDGRGKISEPHATGTSKLDWRSLESMQIDRNKVQIRTNWQKGTGTKKHENFRNFENFKEKKMSKFTFVLNL